MTLASLVRQKGISYATLYNWRNKLRQQGQPVPGNTTSLDDWSAEAKLAVVAETMPLSESELGKYCREKGLYPEQVNEWRQDCLHGFMSSAERKWADQPEDPATDIQHEYDKAFPQLQDVDWICCIS